MADTTRADLGQIQPLVQITGLASSPHEYVMECRACGPLVAPNGQLGMPLATAGLVRQRHLAEHLAALAEEIKEAAR